MNLLILTCLAASLASAQQPSLRPEVLQAIGLYYQAKADLQRAEAHRAAMPSTTTDEQKRKLDEAVADAAERRDNMLASLTGKDQLSYSLAHLQHQRTSALVARQERADRNVALAFLTRLRNVQAGESAATGGTTALTAMANATQWISAAFESGALAKESKGTVTTIRVGGYGVYSWLYPHGQRSCAISNPYCDSSKEMWLRGLSGSISIDNSSPDQSTTQPTQANFTPNPVLSFLGTG
ncbi:MAG: hypothetical protein JNL62_09660, partial [Bryobacterales bacterium]|nr:hypothetical protein [Bryobacterales bacterium]